VKWYFAVSEASIDRPGHGWRGLIRAAVMSAARHTTLVPHMLYDGRRNDFIVEIADLGVRVINHRVSFYDRLEAHGKRQQGYLPIASGAFLRTEIPLLETDDDVVLYTDVDVMFLCEPQFPPAVPELFAVAPETLIGDYADMNSGVMLMNVPAMRGEFPAFRESIVSHLNIGFDQANYRLFFKERYAALDPTLNWKPHWGINPRAQILHWHGPKPAAIKRLLDDPNARAQPNWEQLFRPNVASYAHYVALWERASDQSALETRSTIKCVLDEIAGPTARGWAIDRAAPGSIVRMRILIDGDPLAEMDCSLPRQDVRNAGHGLAVGFEFALPAACADGHIHRLQFQDPHGPLIDIEHRRDVFGYYEFTLAPAEGAPAADVPTRAVTVLRPMVGYIDEVAAGVVRGWAFHRTDPNTPLVLALLIDGTDAGELVCDGHRPDLRTVGAHLTGNVGFRREIAETWLDGETHVLEIRFPDGSKVPYLRPGEPDALSVAFIERPRVVVRAHVDGVEHGMFKGWALRSDPESRRLLGGCYVRVTCNGAHVALVRADRYRGDVARFVGGDPRCGFQFAPPPNFRRSQPQAFTFKVEPEGIELTGSPLVTGLLADRLSERLADMAEGMDRLLAEMLRMRGEFEALAPRSGFTVASYDSWAQVYFAALRTRTERLCGSRHAHQPLVSILVPTYRPDIAHFTAAIESALSQTWHNLEVVIADDGSAMAELDAAIAELRARDTRVRCVRTAKNGGISAATNAAVRAARGDWIAFFDHDDLLVDVAVDVMMRAAEAHDAKLIYSDEDKIDPDGVLSEPAFKPDFNYRYLLGSNYVCHLLMVRADVVRAAGRFRSAYDGAQDHDFILRLTEMLDPGEIHHVPEVLYHWRKTANSTASDISAKQYAVTAGVACVASHLRRRGKRARVSAINNVTLYNVAWRLPRSPEVCVIIPFRDQVETTRRCLDAILSLTKYPALEIVLVDNWSTTWEAAEFCADAAARPGVRVLRVEEEFNYARLNNLAARSTAAEFLVFLNNDVFVSDPAWLKIIMGEALAEPRVAAVGGKFLYPNGRVQHGGIVLGVDGVAQHAHVGLSHEDYGYMGRAMVAQEMSAVTAAGLLIRASAFSEVGGFDETGLKVAYNDVDLCLKLRQRGWKIVWTPDWSAEHHESLSRGSDDDPSRVARFGRERHAMIERWGETLRNDPAYNRNFLLEGEVFSSLVEPDAAPRELTPKLGPSARITQTSGREVAAFTTAATPQAPKLVEHTPQHAAQ
jgi:GT2 family glycosyltransferase